MYNPEGETLGNGSTVRDKDAKGQGGPISDQKTSVRRRRRMKKAYYVMAGGLVLVMNGSSSMSVFCLQRRLGTMSDGEERSDAV